MIAIRSKRRHVLSDNIILGQNILVQLLGRALVVYLSYKKIMNKQRKCLNKGAIT